MTDHIKVPCQHCPFRVDVPPFLHPSRAREILRASYFPCHKTVDYTSDDDDEEEFGGGGRITHRSKACAGWIALGITAGRQDEPEGWQHPTNVYESRDDMIEAYDREWEDRRG